MVANITSTSEFKELTSGDTPVVVDFYADWCGPCKLISPIFAKLSEKPEYQGIKFVKVNTEDQEEVAQEYSIRVMPSFVLFQNGKKVADALGARPAPLEELVKKGVALIQSQSTASAPVAAAAPAPAPAAASAPVGAEAPTPAPAPASAPAPVADTALAPAPAPTSASAPVAGPAPGPATTSGPASAPVAAPVSGPVS